MVEREVFREREAKRGSERETRCCGEVKNWVGEVELNGRRQGFGLERDKEVLDRCGGGGGVEGEGLVGIEGKRKKMVGGRRESGEMGFVESETMAAIQMGFIQRRQL